MNKKNKILVGCLALLLALSVGYALFSQTITINGTATAKGDFELTTTCEKGFSGDFFTLSGGLINPDYLQSGYENDTCVVSDNVVTASVDLLYPSARRYFTVKITNTGTIDAVLPADIDDDFNQTVKVYNSSDDSLYATYNSSDNGFLNNAKYYAYFQAIGDGSLFCGKNSSGSLGCTQDEFNENSMMVKDSSGKSYFRIKAGESIIVAVEVSWRENETDQEHYSKTTMTAEFPFEQITSDMVETNDGVISHF